MFGLTPRTRAKKLLPGTLSRELGLHLYTVLQNIDNDLRSMVSKNLVLLEPCAAVTVPLLYSCKYRSVDETASNESGAVDEGDRIQIIDRPKRNRMGAAAVGCLNLDTFASSDCGGSGGLHTRRSLLRPGS